MELNATFTLGDLAICVALVAFAAVANYRIGAIERREKDYVTRMEIEAYRKGAADEHAAQRRIRPYTTTVEPLVRE